ncbi:chaplin family protein [Streptomyces sp. NPDC004629]|uniref:chaplin family protein n=1 Tax=Streptomyces sp. NPDC004629 TaxID=3364705 RepID=UPI003674EA00
MRKIMTAAVLGASSASLVLTSALGAAAAPAAPEDSGTGSALSGSLLQLPLNIPITVCGNTISILGLEPLSSGGDNGCKHAAQPQDTDPLGGVVGGVAGGVADGGALGGVAGGVADVLPDAGTAPALAPVPAPDDLFLF